MFERFPQFTARIDGKGVLMTDLFVRLVPGSSYLQLVNQLAPYYVGDGIRIEDVAFDLYGDQTLYWVVLLCNYMTNPFAEWPLNEDVLMKRIFDRYPFIVQVSPDHGVKAGDVLQSTDGYWFTTESVGTETLVLKTQYAQVGYLNQEAYLYNRSAASTAIDIRSTQTPLDSIHHYEDVETGYWVDFNANDLAQGIQRSVTNQEYEVTENDKKRSIRVLDKRYLNQFIQSFEREMNR